MAERLNHPFLLKALERASRLTEIWIFWPLHAAAQLFHLTVTRALVKWLFKKKFSCVLDLRLRRSVTTWSSYHLLLSDIDISVIIKDETPSELEPEILAYSEAIRQRLIFIGEFEIYKLSEFKEKARVEADLEPFYSVIRNVRKLSWLSTNSQPYHRYKRERSLKKMKVSLDNWLRADQNGSTRLLTNWYARTARPQGSNTMLALSASSHHRVESFLRDGFQRLHVDPRYNRLLTVQAGYLTPDELADCSNEDLWLHILSSQHERLMVKGRARIVDAAEAAHLLNYGRELGGEAVRCKTELMRRHALVSFNIYGLRVEVTTSAGENGQALLSDIAKEWSYFSSPPSADCAELTMTIRPHTHLTPPRTWPIKTKLCDLAWQDDRRWARYGDKTFAALRDSEGGRSIEVGLHSLGAQAELENLLHSSIGEQLEQAGFIRLHAAAYLTPAKTATVHIARAGAGKSTLVTTVLAATDCAVFGDETILVRDGFVHAYPVRVALSAGSRAPDRVFMGGEKVLAEIPANRVAAPARIDALIFHTGQKTARRRAFAAFVSIGLGLGLPQMKEYMIRAGALPFLLRTLRRRLRFVRSERLEFQASDVRDSLAACGRSR